MKNTRKQNIFVLTTLAAAMVGAFAAMPAYAEDEVAALTQPQNSVDAEVITVGRGSPQFGQYNGLNRSGAYGNANINFRAGDAYTDNENGGTTRVTIIGTDLGLSNRSASAKYEDQGSWSVGIGYDALTHVIGTANGYQTPYGNGVGQNRFTLPSATFPNQVTNSTSLSATQLGAFGPQTIETTRDNYLLNGAYIFAPGLTATFDVNHMVQSGAKLMSFAASSNTTGGTPTGQAPIILPNPTNYQTDTVNAGLNWEGAGARAGVSYFGSFFRNEYDLSGVQFQPMFGAGTAGKVGPYAMQTMSTMPNNMMNQLMLSAGYNLAEKTKIDGSLSYGLNTTSPGAAYDSAMVTAPVSDFDGRVDQLHGDIKLTDRSFKDLTLSVLGKIDERNNKSSSTANTFNSVSGTVNTTWPNAPVSWRKGVLQLAADYKIDKNNSLRLALSNEQMRRWCNNYASVSGSAIFTPGTSCVSGNNDSTNSIDLGYRLKASDAVSFKLGLAYSNRQGDFNYSARTPLAYESPSGQTITTPAGDYLGFIPYYQASLSQTKAKAGASWQASDRLSFNLNGQLTNDNFQSSQYGVQSGYSWSLNLDTNYNWSETGVAYLYASQQQSNRVLTDYTTGTRSTSPVGTWTNTLNNMTTTVGAGAKEKSLMAGKLTVGADALISFANSNYQTGGNFAALAGDGSTAYNCSAAGTMTCGNLSPITNNMYQLKANGLYQVDKHSKIGVAYIYQHLYSSDFYYNGYQVNYTPSAVVPTMQSNPSYAVNVVQAKYIYDF